MTNPKDIRWQSKKYMEWLRKRDCIFCGKPLEQDGLTWELHHVLHGRNNSGMYAQMCRVCHSSYHMNESKFNMDHNMNRQKWLEHCMENMMQYVDSLGADSIMVCLEALAKTSEDNE